MTSDSLRRDTPDVRRVLSIQSHVVSGYVGNKAAVFPMQLLGWDVDVVNTVNFSNHSGYGRFGGPKTDAADLATIFEYLQRNGLLQPERVLTGYIPNAKSLEVVAGVVKELKLRHPDVVYLLDPVMGDAGKLYVSPDVVPIYRSLLSAATIITPNYFEVEVLTGVALTDVESLRTALRVLHGKHGVAHVVVSSIPLNEALRAAVPFPPGAFDEEEDILLVVCSSQTPETMASGKESEVTAFGIPRIPGYFSGTGDMFSALVLAHFDAATGLAEATSIAAGTVHAILRDTLAYSAMDTVDGTDSDRDAADVDRVVKRMRARELRLVQNAGLISGKGARAMRYGWAGLWE